MVGPYVAVMHASAYFVVLDDNTADCGVWICPAKTLPS